VYFQSHVYLVDPPEPSRLTTILELNFKTCIALQTAESYIKDDSAEHSTSGAR
jgi:hypothetical protein